MPEYEELHRQQQEIKTKLQELMKQEAEIEMKMKRIRDEEKISQSSLPSSSTSASGESKQNRQAKDTYKGPRRIGTQSPIVKQDGFRENNNADFLTKSMNEIIALTSYPRSGNTLLRSLLEQVTGIVTGSDSSVKRTLIQQLIELGMKGEGVITMDKVWCVKTHYPERLGYAAFNANRAILLVRNPFDAIVSYFNMILTQSHTLSIEESEFQKFAEVWDEIVRVEIEIWKQFHSHWIALKHLPLLIIRYEDLIQNRLETIVKIVTFLYKVDSIDDLESDIRQRLDRVLSGNDKLISSYVPRSSRQAQASQTEASDISSLSATSSQIDKSTLSASSSHSKWLPIDPTKSGFMKSMGYFSESQKRYIVSTAKSELSYFGYYEHCRLSDDDEPYVYPPIHSLLIEENNEKEKGIELAGSKSKGLAKNSNTSNVYVTINKTYGIRARTKDDPYGRGFSTKWRNRLSKLEPVRVHGGGTVSFS